MLNRLRRTASEGRRLWDAFWTPRMPEEEAIVTRRWDDLPASVRTPDQLLGVHTAGCTATYGVYERCDFACTACYLAEEANKTPPLPFEEVKQQLDMIREYVGPGGNAQITAGEVTLLPCDDLIRILNYCHEVHLSPMVMTHGQNFLKDPSYLHRLMREADCQSIAVHIDTTQRGRIGMKKSDREPNIHWIRNAFAGMIRDARRITGKPLTAAHTFTITPENIEYVPDVVRWCVENADAFRMLSFQPTADVGRTKATEQINKRAVIWDKISQGLGITANRETLHFGHPQCNTFSLHFVVKWGHDNLQVVEISRDDPRSKAFMRRILCDAFAGFDPEAEANHLVMARFLGRLRQNPTLLAEGIAYCGFRSWTERDWLPSFLKAVTTGKPWSIDQFTVIVHNFMSSHELQTEEGKERLEACNFKVPIDGRMVSMCELNGTDMRKDLNVRDRERLVTIKDPARKAS